jgi:hypothetical protein
MRFQTSVRSAVGLMCLAMTAAARAEGVLTTDGTTTVSLDVQLKKGLRAMRPVEFDFLQEVLDQVDSGDLPREMVERAFLWARRYPRYRVQYFEKTLRALARRRRISFVTTVSSFNPGYNTPTN